MSAIEVSNALAVSDVFARPAGTPPADGHPGTGPQALPAADPNAGRLSERLFEICERAGLLLDVQLGPQAWIEAIREQGGWVNPAFDPAASDVDETNTGSVVVRDGDGRFLACNAVRCYTTDSFVGTMRRGELFHRPDHPNATPLPTIMPAGYDVAGRVCYSGGTLVDAAARGKRLAVLTTRLVRTLGEAAFRADWHTGHIFHTRTGEMPDKPYGFQRITPCLEGLPIPERPQSQTLYFVELSRAEFRDALTRDLARLKAEGRQNLDDLALLV
jgi:hypothetical protein